MIYTYAEWGLLSTLIAIVVEYIVEYYHYHVYKLCITVLLLVVVLVIVTITNYFYTYLQCTAMHGMHVCTIVDDSNSSTN